MEPFNTLRDDLREACDSFSGRFVEMKDMQRNPIVLSIEMTTKSE